MAESMQTDNGLGTWHKQEGTPYERAETGFKNYWYPACGSREVGRRPSRLVILGEPIALVRFKGKAYAMIDECPHRGARLSLGKFEFPGVAAISCRFHGWTFDLESGTCVAALTDGPDSPVVGKVRLRTFPVEERKGIVWIWMGRIAPVPLEDDVPRMLLRDGSVVHYRWKVVKGNWRYHLEGGLGAGGSVSINYSRGDYDANGTIHVGEGSPYTWPLTPIVFDGSIVIADQVFPPVGGDLNGTIQVVNSLCTNQPGYACPEDNSCLP